MSASQKRRREWPVANRGSEGGGAVDCHERSPARRKGEPSMCVCPQHVVFCSPRPSFLRSKRRRSHFYSRFKHTHYTFCPARHTTHMPPHTSARALGDPNGLTSSLVTHTALWCLSVGASSLLTHSPLSRAHAIQPPYRPGIPPPPPPPSTPPLLPSCPAQWNQKNSEPSSLPTDTDDFIAR